MVCPKAAVTGPTAPGQSLVTDRALALCPPAEDEVPGSLDPGGQGLPSRISVHNSRSTWTSLDPFIVTGSHHTSGHTRACTGSCIRATW